MNVIDFFGCSFTEAPVLPYKPSVDKFDIELYSMHCHVTKPTSGFLEFDMAYNKQSNYEINNYGKGSFGNFTIHNVISNKVKKLNRFDNNIAIVQLSALLRNEHSWQSIQEMDRYIHNDRDVMNINFEAVRPDYFVEDVNLENGLESFYLKHIDNIKNIISLLKENYDDYIIFFGWDVSTRDFAKVAKDTGIYDMIQLYPYEYPLSKMEYFENRDCYSEYVKKYRGQRGGLLEYASNQLPEEIRYAGERDHHPSYFSNKVFYIDILKPFLQKNVNISKSYFDEDCVKQFEDFLKIVVTNKLKGGAYEEYTYPSLQNELTKYVRTQILNK